LKVLVMRFILVLGRLIAQRALELDWRHKGISLFRQSIPPTSRVWQTPWERTEDEDENDHPLPTQTGSTKTGFRGEST
jgi:hypothetical protein